MKKQKIVIAAIGAALIMVGGGLFYGGNFAHTMVRDELAAQRISFGSKESLEKAGDTEFIKYADRKIDSGQMAKVYSDYINGHLQHIAEGKTYSEVSAEYLKDTSNQKLATQRQTLFMGETLRGLLLNAWGWGLIGTIAKTVAYILAGIGIFCLVFAVLASSKKTPSRRRR